MRGFSSVARLFGLLASLADLGTPPPPPKILGTPLFLKKKSDTVIATERFLADSAPLGNVKRIRSDNDTEFTSNEFKPLLTKNRIRHATSAPIHLTTMELFNLFGMGRCLLIQAKLVKEMWPYAVMAAAYIRHYKEADTQK